MGLLMACLLFNLSYLVRFLGNTIRLMLIKYAKIIVFKYREKYPFLQTLLRVKFEHE